MADYNLNFIRTFITIRVMYYILHCMTQLIRMHMYNTRVHDSSDVFNWLPWSKPPPTSSIWLPWSNPYVIAIYSTSTLRPDNRLLILCI